MAIFMTVCWVWSHTSICTWGDGHFYGCVFDTLPWPWTHCLHPGLSVWQKLLSPSPVSHENFPLGVSTVYPERSYKQTLEWWPSIPSPEEKATSCRWALKINTGTETVHFSFYFTNKEKVLVKMFVLLKVSPGPKLKASVGLPVIHLNKNPFRFLCFCFLSEKPVSW